jgi:hypothetical protein
MGKLRGYPIPIVGTGEPIDFIIQRREELLGFTAGFLRGLARVWEAGKESSRGKGGEQPKQEWMFGC